MTKNVIVDKKISGLSLLEALVSTAIIGIGFVAILQMTNYSVQSIYTSGERTKANYLTSLIAEDVIGNKKIKTGSARSFSDFLSENTDVDAAFRDFCFDPKNSVPDTNVGNIYSGTEVNGPEMKLRKWKALFQTKEYLNCKGENEIRDFQVLKIGSKFSMEPDIIGVNEEIRTVNGEDKLYVLDDFYYIGRVVMNLNDGKKRKFLYFQTDYVLP